MAFELGAAKAWNMPIYAIAANAAIDETRNLIPGSAQPPTMSVLPTCPNSNSEQSC